MFTGRARIALVLALGLVAGLSLWSPGCSTAPSPWPPGKSPKVLASFPPIYSFAKNLVGDDGVLLCLLTSTGPHDYHVGPHDAIAVRGADLFLVNGLGLDDVFANRLKNSSGNVNLRYVELGAAIPTSQLRKLSAAERMVEHEGHTHAHSEYDPHVWLGIPEVIVMVEKLRDELKKLDPDRAADYERRAKAYVEKLQKLQKDGEALVKGLNPEDRRLVTMHDSLAYFARAFGLTIADTIQPRAGVELDATQMKHLVDLCRKEKISVVTVEPQYPENAARTLCAEIEKQGAKPPKVVVLDPLETAEPKELTDLGAEWYEKKMRQNLKNLADALR